MKNPPRTTQLQHFECGCSIVARGATMYNDVPLPLPRCPAFHAALLHRGEDWPAWVAFLQEHFTMGYRKRKG